MIQVYDPNAVFMQQDDKGKTNPVKYAKFQVVAAAPGLQLIAGIASVKFKIITLSVQEWNGGAGYLDFLSNAAQVYSRIKWVANQRIFENAFPTCLFETLVAGNSLNFTPTIAGVDIAVSYIEYIP